jgi:IS5 family transposase
MTPQMKKELKRRSAIEPVIGHMKTDGKLGRNYLLGELGDKINALRCGAGHNFKPRGSVGCQLKLTFRRPFKT